MATKETAKKSQPDRLRGVVEVARRCGVSAAHVHYVVRGKRSSPRVMGAWQNFQREVRLAEAWRLACKNGNEAAKAVVQRDAAQMGIAWRDVTAEVVR